MEPATMTNPGIWYGPKAPGLFFSRARAAAYDNITPFGYYRDYGLGGRTKIEEMKDAVKDFFSIRGLHPDTDNPTWMERVRQNRGTKTDYVIWRNQAWAKAMRQKAPNHKLYVDNGDGTWSYNMSEVDPHG